VAAAAQVGVVEEHAETLSSSRGVRQQGGQCKDGWTAACAACAGHDARK
jgi:hypothetical protein